MRSITTGERTRHAFLLRVDRTAPAVHAVPERPPDYAGWFNRPLRVSFRGTDTTSGIASCSGVTYAGPSSAGVSLGGSCSDVAGNTGSAAYRFNYDATPPAPPTVKAKPGNKRIKLTWTDPPDADAWIVRSGAGETKVVHQGPGSSFTDRRLRNGRRYRYLVTLIDQAGNRASADAAATPTGSKLLSPARGARVHSPPLLEWRNVRGATYFNVQLYRGRLKLLTRWPRINSLQVKRRWRFGGRGHRLVAGRYCWHVWPGFGKRSERDYGRKLGQSCFRVVN